MLLACWQVGSVAVATAPFLITELKICLTTENRLASQNKVFRVFAACAGERAGTGTGQEGGESQNENQAMARRGAASKRAPGEEESEEASLMRNRLFRWRPQCLTWCVSFKSWMLLLKDSEGPDYRLSLGGNNEDKWGSAFNPSGLSALLVG